MTVWDRIQHFKPEEFDSPDAPGSGRDCMDPDFIRRLYLIRQSYGRPMTITSGFRTPAHNAKVGGKPSSAHLTGFAADIAVPGSTERFELVSVAIHNGVRRVGIAKTFVHLDTHPTLPQGVIWLY